MSSFSIKELRDQLGQWKISAPDHKREVIPDSILEEIIKIIPNSSASYIAKRLGVAPEILSAQIKQFKSSERLMNFIEITPDEAEVPLLQEVSAEANKIEYTSSTGTKINFYLSGLETQLISTILKDRAS